MYPDQKTLAQEVKREVIAKLQQGNNTGFPQQGGYSNAFNYGTQGQWGSNPPYAASQTYQTIKDSVKNEVLAEIQMQQVDKMAQMYGLSDQNIQRMIDARYRTIDNLKADIKKELLAIQEMENQRTQDPHIRQAAFGLAEEARRQGIPFEQLTRSLEQKSSGSNGILAKMSEILNKGQRRGFLCGLGATVLWHLLWPAARNNMHSVAVRSFEEGMAAVDRAKSFVSGRFSPTQSPTPPPAPPPTDFSNPVQNPPPGGDQPT